MLDVDIIDVDFQTIVDDNSALTTKKVVKEAGSYLMIFAITAFIMTFVFSLNRIPTGSMEPTIPTGAVAVSWRLPYLVGNPVPERGDIVTFREVDSSRRILIKRVIGLPGDTVSFEQGRVRVNGNELEEPYLMRQDSTMSRVSEYMVPDGCIFVLGDNREHSSDSRFSDDPYVPVGNIIARFLFEYDPLF